MTVINTNIHSLIAQNALKVNGRSMANSMEQLSTGRRITSAQDDAAGRCRLPQERCLIHSAAF